MSMRTISEESVPATHDAIARLAKQIWEHEGRQTGRDLEYWLEAERQLHASRNRPRRLPDDRAGVTTASHGTTRSIRLDVTVASSWIVAALVMLGGMALFEFFRRRFARTWGAVQEYIAEEVQRREAA